MHILSLFIFTHKHINVCAYIYLYIRTKRIIKNIRNQHHVRQPRKPKNKHNQYRSWTYFAEMAAPEDADEAEVVQRNAASELGGASRFVRAVAVVQRPSWTPYRREYLVWMEI